MKKARIFISWFGLIANTMFLAWIIYSKQYSFIIMIAINYIFVYTNRKNLF